MPVPSAVATAAPIKGRKAPLWLSLLLSVSSAVLVCGALALYTACGASAVDALVVWFAAAVAILLPGLAITRLIPDLTAPLRAVLSILWGSVAFAGITLLASGLQMPRLVHAWLVLWAAALILYPLVRPAARKRTVETAARCLRFLGTADGSVLCLTWAVLVFANALWAVHYAHPSAVGALVPSQDFFWNLGNTQSFALGLPLADLRVDGVTVTYHFLTELYQAGLWFSIDYPLPVYDVVAFHSYAPLAAALVACLYGLGRQLWPDCKSRPMLLACMPLWLCCASLWKTVAAGTSRFGNSMALHTLSNINGQVTAYLFLAVALLLLDRLFREQLTAKPVWWASTVAAFYLLTFAKSPEAAILAIALACVLAVLLLQRRVSLKNAAMLFVLIPVGFAVLYKLYFAAGADSSMSFSLTGTVNLYFFASILNALRVRFAAFWPVFVPVLWVAQSLLMAPAAFLAWGFAALRDLWHKLQTSGSRLLWHACTAGGLLAFYLFDHYSSSQIYFANLAVFCMGLFLLEGLPVLVEGRGTVRRVLQGGMAVLLLAGGVTMACLGVYLGGNAARLLWEPAQSQNKLLLTEGEEQACAWLAETMQPDELFATNRMHTGTALEGLSNVYTGLSGCRAYMESFKYAVSNMGERAGDVMTRYDQMNELFSADTSEDRLRQLCAETGIQYLLYCPQAPGDDSQLACFEIVYQNADCIIYRVNP